MMFLCPQCPVEENVKTIICVLYISHCIFTATEQALGRVQMSTIHLNLLSQNFMDLFLGLTPTLQQNFTIYLLGFNARVRNFIKNLDPASNHNATVNFIPGLYPELCPRHRPNFRKDLLLYEEKCRVVFNEISHLSVFKLHHKEMCSQQNVTGYLKG